ncbi:MAG: HEAT repeat domain-containing protein [Clostridiaceae bacterium]|nr:HEAT repeat domain-containing protein [Clostridiaceae bacterium]MBW4859074.1 HEAT repeat domain-containing protein [Clostridiaceae bacterium]MBW4867830.1 HEAT repeat domain-containing protein [Clostridiaceae bacterium]MBW4867979.1 HEAT repeat domain-containing protein [Clostridiaceae bacterium]
MIERTLWKDISKLEDYFITYLLYKEGKPIESIALIRRMSKQEVEKDIIKSKIFLSKDSKKGNKEDKLIKIISLTKKDRILYLKDMTEEEKNRLSDEIYNRYIKFKNQEDRMILIWFIGELNEERFLPFLRMELRSKNVNYRRLACSALGKMKNKEAKPWLEATLKDENPQVRQYAVKALSGIGDSHTLELLREVVLTDEKEYVKRAAKQSIEEIKK